MDKQVNRRRDVMSFSTLDQSVIGIIIRSIKSARVAASMTAVLLLTSYNTHVTCVSQQCCGDRGEVSLYMTKEEKSNNLIPLSVLLILYVIFTHIESRLSTMLLILNIVTLDIIMDLLHVKYELN